MVASSLKDRKVQKPIYAACRHFLTVIFILLSRPPFLQKKISEDKIETGALKKKDRKIKIRPRILQKKDGKVNRAAIDPAPEALVQTRKGRRCGAAL
jgi:hypothetical protein